MILTENYLINIQFLDYFSLYLVMSLLSLLLLYDLKNCCMIPKIEYNLNISTT